MKMQSIWAFALRGAIMPVNSKLIAWGEVTVAAKPMAELAKLEIVKFRLGHKTFVATNLANDIICKEITSFANAIAFAKKVATKCRTMTGCRCYKVIVHDALDTMPSGCQMAPHSEDVERYLDLLSDNNEVFGSDGFGMELHSKQFHLSGVVCRFHVWAEMREYLPF
jgi:hypothetical protein